jgi:hypothetical protein
MTVETERLVEASLRVGDDEQFDAIAFSHGLGRECKERVTACMPLIVSVGLLP